MVRAGQSVIVYNFFIYGGKHSAGAERCGAEESVYGLMEEIPKNQNYQVFLDNWFSTIPLLIKSQSMGILSTATLHSNRVAGCPLMSDKDLKATGRGSFDYGIDSNSLLVLNWYDTKGVIPDSPFSTVKASSTKRRWDSRKKDHCNVAYPDMVKQYNESMDGVDQNDMLISLYCVDIQTRKRWYVKIITHLVNICNVNGCLLYRRCSEQLRVPKKNQYNLLQFMNGVADVLLFAGKEPVRTTPGRPKKQTSSPARTSGKKTMVPKPAVDIRYDGIHHWPEFGANVTDAECVQC